MPSKFHNLFDSKQVHFKAEIGSFLNFIKINFLVRSLKCTETIICSCFAHESMKKTPSNIVQDTLYQNCYDPIGPKTAKVQDLFLMFIVLEIYNFVYVVGQLATQFPLENAYCQHIFQKSCRVENYTCVLRLFGETKLMPFVFLARNQDINIDLTRFYLNIFYIKLNLAEQYYRVSHSKD